MLILRRQGSRTTHDLLAHVDLILLFVNVFDEGRHQRAFLYKIVGTRVLLEVPVQFVQLVVATRNNNHKEREDA